MGTGNVQRPTFNVQRSTTEVETRNSKRPERRSPTRHSREQRGVLETVFEQKVAKVAKKRWQPRMDTNGHEFGWSAGLTRQTPSPPSDGGEGRGEEEQYKTG